MASVDSQPAQYTCVYTIALLPEIKEEDFEKHILEDDIPQFQLTFRPVGAFQLEHHFLKGRSESRADRYVWEIRILSGELVLSATEESLFAELDSLVRGTLFSFGIPVSRTILQELGVVRGA